MNKAKPPDELRAEWEHEAQCVYEFHINDTLMVVVAEWDSTNYSVYRYFSIGKEWVASLDRSMVSHRYAFTAAAAIVTELSK